MKKNSIKTWVVAGFVFVLAGIVRADNFLLSLDAYLVSASVSGEGGVSFVAAEEGLDWLSKGGEPEIPWKFMRVLLPPNADLSTVSCGWVDDEWSAVEGVANVLPATPRMQSVDENQNVVEVWPADKTIVDGRDVAIYAADAFWSGSADCCSGTGNLQGWKLAEVAVPLARYNPVQGQLELLTSAQLAVRYETQEVLVAPNLSVAKRVRELVVNFDEMAENYLSSKSADVSKYPADKKGYLIAATKDVQAASTNLAAFIAHKQSMGFTVAVIDEDDTGGATAGPGAPSVIKFREWLQANYGPSELRYLLIIADPRTDQANSYFPMGLYKDESPTDYFYAELTCDWDTDSDGVWGEDSEWDRYFELYVGRIPYYGTIADTDSILQKTIDYESSTDVAWRRRGLISACPLEFQDINRHYYDWAEQVKADLFEPQAIPMDRLYKDGGKYTVLEWAAANQIDPPPEYPTEDALNLQWASTPYGMVALNSHGWSGGIQEIINAEKGDVDVLVDAYPSSVFLGACSAAAPEVVNNITYAMLKNGAIASIGATRASGLWFSHYTDSAGYPGMSYSYQKGVLENQSCGESLWNLKEEISGYWTGNWTLYNLYGDPSVKVFPEDDRPDFTVLPTHRFYGVRYASSPYSLTSRTYTFVNDSAVSINWTASKSASWFDLSATSGTIPANSTATIEVTMNSAVEAFGMGQQLAHFTVTDTTHSISYDRGVEFEYKHAQIFRHNQFVFQGADGAATSLGYENSFDRHMHTVWNATNTVDHLPEYQLDLRMPYELTGLAYMGSDSTSTGRIRGYEFYTSMDGTNWGVRVATGSFANSADAQEVLFDTVYARYVRLVALSVEGGGDVAKLNDLKIYHRWNDRGIRSRLYSDIGGGAITNLTSDVQYPNYAVIHSIRPTFEGDHNRDEIYGGYGVRYDGFIVPPTTGNYTFWVASDDAGQLWLSSDATTNNLSMIASLSAYASFHEWTKYSSQQSVSISLTAGVPYAVMGLHKEGGGDDHYAVAWSGPGFARNVIETPFLSYEEPVLSASSPVMTPDSLTIFDGANMGTLVGTVVATDADAGEALSYYIVDGNADKRFSINPDSGEIYVAAPIDAAQQDSYSLLIAVVDASGNNTLGQMDVTVRTNSSIIPSGALSVYYMLDEVSGTTVPDAAGGNNNGTLSGGTWMPAEGVHGGSLYMDGIDDSMDIADSSEINLMTVTNRTIALWFRADALVGQGKQMLYEEGGNVKGINLYLDEDVLYMNVWSGGAYIQKTGLNAGQWYHAALTIDSSSGEMRGYLDGVEFAQASCTAIGSHLDDIGIGHVNGTTSCHDLSSLEEASYFAGHVDDFVLYNRTLSASGIEDLVHANSAPELLGSSLVIAEDTPVCSVVETLLATDDLGDSLTYSLTNSFFSIDFASGEISVSAPLDYETTTVHTLLVTVQDGEGLTDTATVTVNVTDVVNDDSDTDGLTDEWEVINFTTVAAQTGDGDADSDGLTNAQEETLGSNPNDPLSGPSIGLKAWWKLDETSGTTASDHSGNGWDAENVNGTLVGQLGRMNGAFVYDGVDDYSKTIATSEPNSAQFSITAWIKPSTASESITILGKSYQFSLQVTTDAKLRFLSYPYNNSYSDPLITRDEWQFVVITFTPSAVDGCCFYRNGTLMNAVNSPSIDQNGNMLTLGKNQHGQYFSGGLDDVRLYDRVLSASEVDTLYKQVVLNQAPIAQDASFAVAENSTIGSTVGMVSASDPDAIDTLDFSITAGNDDGKFAIDSVTGEITVAGSIDYETLASYSLTVSVTDGTLSDTATISITVTDVPNDDSDADGLIDEWEVIHFGSVAAQDGSGDPDGDVASNRQEQTFGTDPMDANDAPSAEYINLRGWWKLDETTGTVAFDSSGNGLNASNTNGVLVSQSGHVNGAFGFDGIDDFSKTQPSPATGSNITITAWIHPSNISGDQSILAKNSSFTLKLNGSSIRFTTPGHWDHVGSSAFVANDWQFVAVTFTPSATGGCRFYRNGVLLNAVNSSVIDQNSNSLLLGNNQWDERFAGGLDDIRLYDRVLTDTEIDALYQQDAGVYNQWKGTHFTAAELADPAISDDDADIDADQLGNLIEYALGLDPKVHSGSLAGCAIELDGSNGWKVEFNRYASRNDIDLVLEWSDELNPANWQPVAQSIAGGVVQPLNGTTLVSETGTEPTVVELNVPSTVPHGFIRWKVERR